MRVTSFLGLGLFGLMAASTACDDSTGGTGGGSSELTLGTYYDAYDKARCDYFVRCGYLSDKSKCDQAYGPDRDAAQGIASAVFGGLGFDAAKAQTCIDSFALALCDTPPYAGLSKSIDVACDAVFTGKGAEGADCYDGVECESGYCDTSMAMGCDGQCCVGKCKAIPLVPSGGDCAGGLTCVDTDFCDPMENKCKPRKGANEACTTAYSCVAGYVCDDQGGKCFKAAPSGGSCNPTLMTSPCEQAAAEYCSPDTKTCVAAPKVGEPCIASGPNMGGCARDAYCTNETGTSVCKALPSEGEMCLGDPGTCLGTLECDDATKLCVRKPTTTCLP